MPIFTIAIAMPTQFENTRFLVCCYESIQ